VNGWYAPSGDADTFSERIRLLLNNRAELEATSRRSSEYVAKAFSWERSADRYLELLRDPLARAGT